MWRKSLEWDGIFHSKSLITSRFCPLFRPLTLIRPHLNLDQWSSIVKNFKSILMNLLITQSDTFSHHVYHSTIHYLLWLSSSLRELKSWSDTNMPFWKCLNLNWKHSKLPQLLKLSSTSTLFLIPNGLRSQHMLLNINWRLNNWIS